MLAERLILWLSAMKTKLDTVLMGSCWPTTGFVADLSCSINDEWPMTTWWLQDEKIYHNWGGLNWNRFISTTVMQNSVQVPLKTKMVKIDLNDFSRDLEYFMALQFTCRLIESVLGVNWQHQSSVRWMWIIAAQSQFTFDLGSKRSLCYDSHIASHLF